MNEHTYVICDKQGYTFCHIKSAPTNLSRDDYESSVVVKTLPALSDAAGEPLVVYSIR